MIPIDHQPAGYWATNLYAIPRKRPKSDAPLKPVIIQKIEEIDASAAAPAPHPAAAPADAPPSTSPIAPSPPPK